MLSQAEAAFYPRFNNCKEIFAFKVGAGLVVGEIHTLPGPCHMDGATLADTSIGKKEARAVFLGFKCVFSHKKLTTDLTVTYLQVAANAVNILCCNQEDGTLELIAAISGTKITEYFAGCKRVGI